MQKTKFLVKCISPIGNLIDLVPQTVKIIFEHLI